MVAAELHPADEGDTATLEKTLAAAKKPDNASDIAILRGMIEEG